MRETKIPSVSPELALRVEERQAGQFFWVILSAGLAAEHRQQVEHQEALYYEPYRFAIEPQPVYWNALLMGMAELRRVLAMNESDACRSRAGRSTQAFPASEMV